MESRKREVLLYGTSANPLVGMQGHMGAIAHCAALGFDEVWVLPVYQHIYSSKRGLAPFEHRVKMSSMVVAALASRSTGADEHPGIVSVKEYERELFEHLAASTDKPEELRIGSIDLVKYLSNRFPDTSFTMLLGADTFADLRAGKWKNGDELQRLVKLLVMNRVGYNAPDMSGVDSDRVRFVTIPSLTDISSTRVRAITDEQELRAVVETEVADYIVHHKLYGFASS